MTDVQFFKNEKGVTAYKQTNGDAPVALFLLSGHSGTFDSPIRQVLADYSCEYSIPLTHFTYFGRDQSSSGSVSENGVGYVQHRLDQAIALFDAVTTGPQILVGLSMGGYLALALAQARPERVKGIVGLAAGFGTELIESMHSQYRELRIGTATETGFRFEVAPDNSMPIVGGLTINCPIRLLHAMADEVVSYKNTDHIAKAVMTNDVIIRLTKTGSHSLSEPRDAMWLNHALSELIFS